MTSTPDTIFARLRRSLVRGALFFIPIWLCWFVVGLLYQVCEGLLGGLTAQLVLWVVPQSWLPAAFAGGHIPGLSLLVAIVLLTLIGVAASVPCGRSGLRIIDLVFLRIPGVRTIYSAARKVIDAIGEPGQSRFQKVVLIDWPGQGLQTLGFVTNEGVSPAGEKEYWVFVPTMPNPTSGFVVKVLASAVTETSLGAEEGLKIAMSLGVLAPPDLGEKRPKN